MRGFRKDDVVTLGHELGDVLAGCVADVLYRSKTGIVAVRIREQRGGYKRLSRLKVLPFSIRRIRG